MKTIQGKEFNYNDILLYTVKDEKIIVIVNDKEQLDKYKYSAVPKDAPISIIPYTKEVEKEIIENKKKISEYKENSQKGIDVRYVDGTEISFDSSNKEIVEKNLYEQRENEKLAFNANLANMTEEEKETRKESTNQKAKRYLAAALAALVVGGAGVAGYYNGKHAKPVDNPVDEDTTKEDLRTNVTATEESVVTVSQYLNEGKALYQETVNKNSFVLKYQQAGGIRWSEDLSVEVVEYLNGVYPTAMRYMSEENATAELIEAQEAIRLLVAGNLNSETKESDIIDIASYITNNKDRVLINNAMVIAKNAINEAIGEPTYGTILDEDDYSSVGKFSREYLGAVDELLNYEYDTITDPAFLEMSSSVRFIITSIFQQANAAVVPTWSYVTRNSQNIYYRNFVDDATGVVYLPRQGKNGTTEYVASTGEVYNEEAIFVMAGTPLDPTARNYTEQVNPNLHKVGIENELERVIEAAGIEMAEMKNEVIIK